MTGSVQGGGGVHAPTVSDESHPCHSAPASRGTESAIRCIDRRAPSATARPRALLDARAAHADVVRPQQESGLQTVPDGEFRRPSWHLDLIYAIDGIRRRDEQLQVHVRNAGSTTEAARFVPLDQLSLSPQCGFSSTVEGNALTQDEDVVKLRLVVETAQQVWG